MQCSFCGKKADALRKLIAGPTVFICDECVAVCVDILAQDAQARVAAGETEAAERVDALARKLPENVKACSLCGKTSSLIDMLPIEQRGIVCAECADAIEDTLARGKPAP